MIFLYIYDILFPDQQLIFILFQGFFQLMCSKSCCVYFHKICWKKFKNLKYPGENDQVFHFFLKTLLQHFFLYPFLFFSLFFHFFLLISFPLYFTSVCFFSLIFSDAFLLTILCSLSPFIKQIFVGDTLLVALLSDSYFFPYGSLYS